MQPRQQTSNPWRPSAGQHPKGLGILERSAGRGDPSAAGRGKFLLTRRVNKTRRAAEGRFCSERSRGIAEGEGKIPVYRRRQGVSLRLFEAVLGGIT